VDMNLRQVCLATLSVAFIYLYARSASATVTVFGKGMAHIGSQAAHHLAQGEEADSRSLDACNRAIGLETCPSTIYREPYQSRRLANLSRRLRHRPAGFRCRRRDRPQPATSCRDLP
jgi:hypothetical protein